MEDIVDDAYTSPGDYDDEIGDSNHAELSDNELVDEFLAEPRCFTAIIGDKSITNSTFKCYN